uniref:Uncharacterized protein n=1 Tax=Timema poppense TaxID=170557 RepID=A0A7R9DKS9_TIMPO|nr:unnamed protein product [Timema poppensis]
MRRSVLNLRHLDICSVDPPGCTDIDDALHCRDLANGNYEYSQLTITTITHHSILTATTSNDPHLHHDQTRLTVQINKTIETMRLQFGKLLLVGALDSRTSDQLCRLLRLVTWTS